MYQSLHLCRSQGYQKDIFDLPNFNFLYIVLRILAHDRRFIDKRKKSLVVLPSYNYAPQLIRSIIPFTRKETTKRCTKDIQALEILQQVKPDCQMCMCTPSSITVFMCWRKISACIVPRKKQIINTNSSTQLPCTPTCFELSPVDSPWWL